MSEKCCSGVTNVETMRLGSELTLLTNLFPDLHATVVGGLTAIHENIILMQVSTIQYMMGKYKHAFLPSIIFQFGVLNCGLTTGR